MATYYVSRSEPKQCGAQLYYCLLSGYFFVLLLLFICYGFAVWLFSYHCLCIYYMFVYICILCLYNIYIMYWFHDQSQNNGGRISFSEGSEPCEIPTHSRLVLKRCCDPLLWYPLVFNMRNLRGWLKTRLAQNTLNYFKLPRRFW